MRLGRSFTRLACALYATSFLLPCLAVPGSAQTSDKDHRLVKPFPGSQVTKTFGRNLDEYWIVLGKLFGDGQAEKHQLVEGKWTHFTYSNPDKATVVEIFRSYHEQFLKEGFEIVYSCLDAECGAGGRKSNGDWWDPNHLRRYLAARLAAPEGDVWVCVHVEGKRAGAPGHHDVDIVEVKPPPMPPRVEKAPEDPATLAKELERTGRVPLYGISFDPGKATPRPESEPAIQAVAELLARDSALKLYVVVHTDNADGAASSLRLSRRRAAALVSMLVKKHKVAPERLHADGVGPLAPLASNATEEGRAENRRVELVRP